MAVPHETSYSRKVLSLCPTTKDVTSPCYCYLSKPVDREVAQRLRVDSPQELASILNKDPILLRAMEAEGLPLLPSVFLPPPHTISEHMFIRLVDNQNIGGRLINAHWRVVRLGPRDGTLILSDRPLVRLFGCDNPKAPWFFAFKSHSCLLRGIFPDRP